MKAISFIDSVFWWACIIGSAAILFGWEPHVPTTVTFMSLWVAVLYVRVILLTMENERLKEDNQC
jgi:hypothetical protein